MLDPFQPEQDPIRRYQHDLRQLSEAAENMRPLLKACEDAIARAGSKAVCALKTSGMRPHIDVMLMAKSLDESVVLLRELAKEGLHSKEKKFEDRSLADVISMRTYALTPQVSLTVMLMGDQCKLKQVGTKVVPVFEMRCGQPVEEPPKVVSHAG